MRIPRTEPTATAGASTAPPSHTLPANTRFYVDPGSDAVRQTVAGLRGGDFRGAEAMAGPASWPEAAWFTDGTPTQVEARVRDLVRRAERTRTVPVPGPRRRARPGVRPPLSRLPGPPEKISRTAATFPGPAATDG